LDFQQISNGKESFLLENWENFITTVINVADRVKDKSLRSVISEIKLPDSNQGMFK